MLACRKDRHGVAGLTLQCPAGRSVMIEGYYWYARDRRARGRVAALRITHSAGRLLMLLQPLRLAGPSSGRRRSKDTPCGSRAMMRPGGLAIRERLQ